MKTLTFDECIKKIDEELKKQAHKWTISLPHLSYEDVSQIIRKHISVNWDKYDQTRSLGPWVAQIIGNQIKNLMRNNFASFAKPCHNCPFAERAIGEEDGGCAVTSDGIQGVSCALYKRWHDSKRDAYNIKVPVSMNSSVNSEVSEQIVDNQSSFDIESSISRMHAAMRKSLNPKLYKAYSMIYIEKSSDEDVAKFMGYKSREKSRSAGYKQIRNLKEQFLTMAKKLINNEDIIL